MSRLSDFRALLAEHGYDAAIVSEGANQRYLSGFEFHDGLILVTRGASYLLTDFRYVEAAREKANAELAVLTPDEGHMPCISGLLAENGCRTVATEDRSKDDEELACIERAQRITDAAFTHILSVLTPDMTEIEVALELEYFMRKNGAEGLAFDTIAVSGSNSSRPHGTPRHCKLERGFLTMDYGARVDGYCADMTRTVCLGKADADMKKLYQTVLTAQTNALEAAAEGAFCRELDRIARDVINGAGYEGCFGHSLGHGVGLYVHETPNLSPKTAPDVRLERGHAVTFEPGIYVEGKYGCRIEDLVAVRNDGSIYDFTKSPKELIELF